MLSNEHEKQQQLAAEQAAIQSKTQVNSVQYHQLLHRKEELEQENIALRKRAAEVEIFFAISILSKTKLSFHEYLSAYVESICQACEFQGGHVYVPNEARDELILQSRFYERNFSGCEQFTQDSKDHVTLMTETDLPFRVFVTEKAYWFNDLTQENNIPRAKKAKENGVRGIFALPIKMYDDVEAVVEFMSDETFEFFPPMSDVIPATAAQLSVLLEKRNSEERLEASYRELQNMYEELKMTQAQLIQSSKMASIGQLAAGIAHEINNPIAFVAGNINSLNRYLKVFNEIFEATKDKLQPLLNTENESMRELYSDLQQYYQEKNLNFLMDDIVALFDESQDGMKRVTEIVQGLKTFAHIDEAEMQYANVNDCIKSTVKLMANEFRHNCKLEEQYDESLPELYCNPAQLNQVFMNVLANAVQALEKQEGTVRVVTQQDDENNIVITVSDTGCGIKPEHLPKLFEPFFTTKPVGFGTGLGLSISYNIIGKHGGTMKVASEFGKGSIFTITLPRDACLDNYDEEKY
ncbi:MAG: hypothetical protein Tsb005_04740 [Gammaproteobacteria bacterium]